MDTRLMELLVCPLCKGPLKRLATPELACNADRLAFPIRDGLPILLEDAARAFDPEQPEAGAMPAASADAR